MESRYTESIVPDSDTFQAAFWKHEVLVVRINFLPDLILALY